MISSNKIQWGIIGCGDVCEVKSGPAFNKVSNSELVAVMRRDFAKAQDYATRNNVPDFFDDADKIIHHNEINAIYIATPPAFHEDYAIKAIMAGKPVYIEKPVATNSESCRRIIQVANEYGVKATVAHYRRALPNFKKVKQLINENAIGAIRLIKITTLQPEKNNLISNASNWRLNPEISGGGLFHDLAPHQLDIVYWIFGKMDKANTLSLNQAKKYIAPDHTFLQGVVREEISFTGIWSFNVAKAAEEEMCEIIGEKGKIKFSFFRKPEVEIHSETGVELLSFSYPENIQLPMIDAVVKYFKGEGTNPCSLEEALITMEIMDKTIETFKL